MKEYIAEMSDNIPDQIEKELRKMAKSETHLVFILEEFIERAGILEYEGKKPRKVAEDEALEMIVNNIKERQK